jgi:peptide/nickel transport system substrate-binding protein
MARAPVLARRTFALAVATAPAAFALGRTPTAGNLRLSLPFDPSSLDPHAADSPLAALFGPAIAEPLFALDAEGRPYPTLAAALPERSPEGARVSLRPRLTTARGKVLVARDAVFSLERSRRLGGAGVLGELAAPVLSAKEPLTFLVPGADPAALAVALASPLTALVPRGFSSIAPDGAGPFRATPSRDGLLLERNLRAARGPSFLASITVTRAADLAAALRAFEAGQADVGFLGAGLHRARPGAVAFEGPVYGWAVLRAGREAGAWGAPGVTQGLSDRVSPDVLRHLGVSPVGGKLLPNAGWGGNTAEILVDADSPLLHKLAETAAPMLGGSAALGVRAVPRVELAERRSSGAFALMIDFVRIGGPPGRSTLLSLLAAVSPALAARPPRATSTEPRDVARTLPLGVIGALRLTGFRMPTFAGLEAFQLGNVYVEPPAA